ncbi:MAG: CotH kinase family protein [Paludibacteraceae bacterium]|nr:CotH kinase family protein [Paludibacteraceae bacterium]
MKNFTNNFKQFTSRLSARWLIMALMMLVGTSSAWAATHTFAAGDYIYIKNFVPSGWGSTTWILSNSYAYVHMWGGTGGEHDYLFELYSGTAGASGAIYRAKVEHAGTYTHVIFTRNSAKGGPWNNKWNQTGDIEMHATYNCATSFTADGTSKTWSCYDDVAAYTVSGEGSTVKLSDSDTWATYTLYKDDTAVSSSDKRGTGSALSWDLTESGTYTVKGTNGCRTDAMSGSYTYSSCTNPSNPSIAIDNAKVCSGKNATITVTGTAEQFQLYTVSNGTYTAVGSKQAGKTFTVSEAKTYAVKAFNGTCESTGYSNTVSLTLETPSKIELASNPTICDGTEITLADYVKNTTVGTVTWYSNSGLTQVADATVTPRNSGTASTKFYYYAVAKNGVCNATAAATLTVTVDPQSRLTLKNTEITICSGTTVAFPDQVDNANTVGTVTWYTDSNMSKSAGTTVTPNATNIYYAKAVSGTCSAATAQLKVNVNDKPAVPTLSADKTSLVSPDKATLTAGNTTNGLTYTLYNGETPGESKTSTGSDLTFTVGEAGSYTVRVSNSCGTSVSTSEVTVTVCTPQINTFVHTNSSYVELQNQNPTYYVGDKVYFKATLECCLTGTWKKNEDELWWTGMKADTPFKFYIIVTKPGEHIISNLATDGCKDVADADVDVKLNVNTSALSQVTNTNGTASGANIALTWNHSANHSNVMVVRYPINGTETIPAGGQAYTEGNTLGDGTVVYVGTETSYTDQNLPAGASYKYYFYTVNNNYYSEGVMLNMSSCPIPEEPELTSTAVTACDGVCTAVGYVIIGNMDDYTDDTYTFQLGSNPVTPDANGKIEINSIANTQYTVTVTNSCGNPNSATVDIAINDNKPTITGNNSFKPGGSTTLTSDKGANTTWVALDGGDVTPKTGASVEFTAKDKRTYHVQATYNGCSTTYTINVQDDLYVWVRRPIKKETAYEQFYHENQNSDASIGGDLFYKEFASLPGDYQQYNQGGKAADEKCTDKDGYTWYGFIVSKTAIENDYYFTVHAPNDKGYGGFHTHTYATQLVDMDADLYFVMDETPSNLSRGWNINAPVVVRASGDAKFNSNNFADFVPLYVKDANICGKEVESFEWQKSASENGAYNTYKSGKGVNNIRTREAGWYRCVVTYAEGKGTATSNAIQVTNTTSGTPGTLADFSSKLPVIMVNTNGVGFPSDKNLATKNTNCGSGKRYPSLYADDLKEKVTVDVIIKKGNEIIYDRKARMNYRGSSSLNFKKKSYAFCSGQDSCVFDKGRHDYVKTKKEKMLNILGLNYKASDKDWVLYAATPDPSMMRNRLVFDLYQQMRKDDWGVHSTYVELIVDGEYRGVYIFMDKITANKDRVNITNENGFIVKFDKTDVADRVENKEGDQKTFATSRTGTPNSSNGIESYGACIDQRFEIEYPEKEDIALWDAFYEKVQKRFEDFETALYNKQYDRVRELIDYDSWADWFIISEFIKNQDGFRASNFFIYDGDKIIAMPLWDQELSMDNRTRIAHGSNVTDGLLNTTNSVYTDAFPATFWFTGHKGPNITGGLLNDPCFVSLVKQKWAAYQADQLSAENISEMVAQYHNELDDAIRKRESDKWPYTEAARGKTTDGDYMGYYAEGDPDHYSYNASKNAIISYATARSTDLEANSGMGKAINGLKGEALIFMISPSEVETTPWQSVQITVSAPEGYDYTLNTDELEADNAVIKENGDAYGIKIPRPNDWATGGNGTAKSKVYNVTATIEVSGDNACGTAIANTAQSTITLSDVTENCDPEIVKP